MKSCNFELGSYWQGGQPFPLLGMHRHDDLRKIIPGVLEIGKLHLIQECMGFCLKPRLLMTPLKMVMGVFHANSDTLIFGMLAEVPNLLQYHKRAEYLMIFSDLVIVYAHSSSATNGILLTREGSNPCLRLRSIRYMRV